MVQLNGVGVRFIGVFGERWFLGFSVDVRDESVPWLVRVRLVHEVMNVVGHA